MLQWMGGSRRKITTSRKSTQRRQKQYFEQKRRQQQQKNSGSDSYAEGTNVDHQQRKENRSLDVLSLLNLSTTPQEYKSSCPDRSSILLITDPKVKHQFRNFPPTAIADAVTHVRPTEVHEAGYQFGSQDKALLLMNEADSHVSNEQKNELGHKTRILYEPRTSVLDLLGDDPSDRNLEISPANEDHVAFSLNGAVVIYHDEFAEFNCLCPPGIGRVGTETPVHTPPQIDRSTVKHSGLSDMLENRDHALDDLDFEAMRCLKSMMKSLNVPYRQHPLRSSMGIEDWYGNLEANTCTWDDLNHHWRDSSIITSSGHKDVWEASSTSLNSTYFLGGDYGISWDKRPFKVDDLFDDFITHENHELSEHDFDGVCLLKKRVTAEAGDRSKTLGSLYLNSIRDAIVSWLLDFNLKQAYDILRGSEEAYKCSTVMEDPRESSSFQR